MSEQIQKQFTYLGQLLVVQYGNGKEFAKFEFSNRVPEDIKDQLMLDGGVDQWDDTKGRQLRSYFQAYVNGDFVGRPTFYPTKNGKWIGSLKFHNAQDEMVLMGSDLKKYATLNVFRGEAEEQFTFLVSLKRDGISQKGNPYQHYSITLMHEHESQEN